MNRLAVLGTAGLLTLAPVSALAGSYDALCGGTGCVVNVSSREISSPQGTIPVSRVSYWSVNGKSGTSVGTGVATTILLGGIGLLGFLAKNHDYNVTVDGYDAEGKKVSMQFKFKNSKPVKLLTEEMYQVSGLPMGKPRSIAEIKAIEAGEAPLTAMAAAVEPELAAAKKEKVPECGKVLKPFKCNWDDYLAANPNVKAWAEANPAMAEKEKIRQGALSDEDIEAAKKAKEAKKLGSTNSLGTLEQ